VKQTKAARAEALIDCMSCCPGPVALCPCTPAVQLYAVIQCAPRFRLCTRPPPPSVLFHFQPGRGGANVTTALPGVHGIVFQAQPAGSVTSSARYLFSHSVLRCLHACKIRDHVILSGQDSPRQLLLRLRLQGLARYGTRQATPLSSAHRRCPPALPMKTSAPEVALAARVARYKHGLCRVLREK